EEKIVERKCPDHASIYGVPQDRAASPSGYAILWIFVGQGDQLPRARSYGLLGPGACNKQRSNPGSVDQPRQTAPGKRTCGFSAEILKLRVPVIGPPRTPCT